MKLTQVPNLRIEDFPGEQKWIGKLFIQLNPFIQSLNQILTSNVDYSTNIRSVTREYSISSFQVFSFLWNFPEVPPVSVQVIQATQGSARTPTILGLAWSFDNSTRLVTVSRMVEILASSVRELSGEYQFTVRATV
jgi:hypothetical protein